MIRFVLTLYLALGFWAETATADCSLQTLATALAPARPDVISVQNIIKECDEAHATTNELIAKVTSRGEEFVQYRYFDLALQLYEIAAAHGDAQAQSNLGWLYHNGKGVTRDDAEAVRLFKLSADAGNADGEANLARMYELGAGGLAKSDADADRLYRSAAAKWNQFAIERLRMRHPSPSVSQPAPARTSLGDSLLVTVEYARVRAPWQNEAATAADEPLLTIPFTIVDSQEPSKILGHAAENVLLNRTARGTFVLSLLDETRGTRYDFDVGSKTGISTPIVSGYCPDSGIAAITDTGSQRVVTLAFFARHSPCSMYVPEPTDGFHALNPAPRPSINIDLKSTLQDATLEIVGSHFQPAKLPQTLELTGGIDVNDEPDTYQYVVIRKPGYFDSTFAFYCQWDQSGGGVLHVNKREFRFSKRNKKIDLPPITLRPMP